MKLMFLGLFVSISAFAEDCFSNGDCSKGYYCKIQWREGPYQCVKRPSKVSSGQSSYSIGRAREDAELNAMKLCQLEGIHYRAEQVSPYQDSSFANSGVEYTYISSALFRCSDGAGF